MEKAASNTRFVDDLVPGVLVSLPALPLAWLMSILYRSAGGNTRGGVARAAVVVAAAVVAGLVAYAVTARRDPRPWRFGFAGLVAAAVGLLASYFFWVGPIVNLHADFLIWSESMFVNDIIKFRTGHPLYTGAGAHQSFIYTPGAPLTTYVLASLVGLGTSIPTYRVIQILYVFVASVLAVACCRELLRVSGHDRPNEGHYRWGLLWLPVFLLVATNQETNRFTSYLHNSPLQLVFMIGSYLLVLKHSRTQNARLLILMALLPGVGYMIKQSASIWAGLFAIYIVFFCKTPRLPLRLLAAVGCFAGVGAAFGLFYALWGADYVYWTTVVLGARGQAISLMRSINHALAVWPYFAAGFLGAALLFSKENLTRILGPWVVWLILVGSEAYTNGVAWKRHHLGPGSLIAAVWLMALVTRYWPRDEKQPSEFRGQQWLRTGVAVALFVFVLYGMGAVRVPMEPFPSRDLDRYVAEIEREFADGDPKTILLDVGAWVYLPHDHVKMDSAIPIGDQGMSGTCDFSEIRWRLTNGHYTKLLIRHLDEPDRFWYDHSGWPKSSGIRKILLEQYRVVRKIEPVALGLDQKDHYTHGEISVLVPVATSTSS